MAVRVFNNTNLITMKYWMLTTILLLFILPIIAQETTIEEFAVLSDPPEVFTGAPADLLEFANEMYVQQEYERAVMVYEQLLSDGWVSAQLHFNLGNAYFKRDLFAQALLNYERALLLAPGNEDIDFNIRMAQQYTVDTMETLPQPFFLRWRLSVIQSSSADSWGTLSLSAFLVFLLMLATFLLSRKPLLKRLGFWSAMAAFAVSAFTFSFANQQHKTRQQRPHAIVFCPRVAVKSAPGAAGTDLFLIHEGLKVEITDSMQQWKEIRLPNGNKGWMPDSCAVRI